MIHAVAEAWASIDGKLERYIECKNNPELDETEGRYMGYNEDASELIKRIEKRGFKLVRIEDEPSSKS